jgi:thiamine-phosphate pyrophosphorylase
VLVNDRCDVALGSGAAGVHVRDDGPPVGRVRALAPPDWMIGRSVHRLEALPQHAGATYFIFGTIFATASKGPGARVQGIGGLRAAVAATSLPVLAIGGMDVANARTCIDAGAAGIAAIGLFLPEGREPGARGVAKAVREIKHV